jgi:hypothetical protein
MSAPEEKAGTPGMCPRCMKWVTVPASEVVAIRGPAPPAADAGERSLCLSFQPLVTGESTSSNDPPREMLRFPCPHCKGRVKAPKDKIGVPGVCPRCRKWFTVPGTPPGASPSSSSSALDLQPAPPPSSEAPRSEANATPAAARTGTLATALGALLVLGLVFFLGTRFGRRLLVAPLAQFLIARGLPPPAGWAIASLGLVVVVGLPLAVALALAIKRQLVAGMPERLEFLPANANQFPGLDKKALLRYTSALQDLGFVHALDYIPHSEIPTANTGFARLFTHPDHGCYAEINQVVPAQGEAKPMALTFMSVLDQDWNLTSGDRDPHSLRAQLLWRRPKSLWTCHAGASPHAVLAAHLERRRQIVEGLDLKVPNSLSAKAYFLHEQQAAIARKQALRQKNIAVGLVEYWLAGKKPQQEWMGAYPKLARVRDPQAPVAMKGAGRLP